VIPPARPHSHRRLLDQLVAAGPTAVRALAALLSDDDARTRLQAARALLAAAIDAGEAVEIVERLDALERRLSGANVPTRESRFPAE
jgi:hypothetical protein